MEKECLFSSNILAQIIVNPFVLSIIRVILKTQ